jgi:RNA polymerase sigma factor (sigma-70 family)
MTGSGPDLVDPRTDGQLLQSGDADDFGVFYERHAAAVLSFAYRLTFSADVAADVTAETFAEALLSRLRYQERGAGARGWLLTIARRQVSRYLRREAVQTRARRRLGLTTLGLDETSYQRIEELADFTGMRDAIRAAMTGMPRRNAQALYLRVGLELDYPEIASRLGCTEGAARVRVARGLRSLQQALTEAP